MKKNLFFCLIALAGLSGLLLPAASITVTSPVAGETLRTGCVATIRWTATDVAGDVRIALYRGVGGDRLGLIENRIPAAAGSFSWTVGELGSGSAGSGDDYRIHVVEILGATTGQSGAFSITPAAPMLHVISPNGGEALVIGADGGVRYEYSNLPGRDLVLELYRGGTAAANRVGRLYPDAQSGHSPCGSSFLAWHNGYVSGTYAAEGRNAYYVRVMTPDGSLSDFSDAPFSLAAPPAEEPAEEPSASAGSITISSPLAPLTLSHDFSLGWNARNIDGELVINVLREAGGTWTIATSVDPGRAYGRFHWIVGQLPNRNSSFPPVAGQRFRFQISGRGSDGRAVIATGRWFEIVSPGISVSEPHANERLERGGHKTIMWSAPALHGGVHIEAYYRPSGGASFSKYSRLFEDVANNGHRTWNIWGRPHGMTGSIDGPPSGNGVRWHIRVISARCPWIFAEGPEFILE